MKDSVIPTNTDLDMYTIHAQGDKPQRTFVTVFEYGDGSIRSYDGRAWKLLAPSHKVEGARLYSAVTGKEIANANS